MKRYGYLIVEGQHDIAFISRLLQPLGLKQINKTCWAEKSANQQQGKHS